MSLTKLSLQNTRSYDLFSTELDPGLTLILGKNGSGKTTLLEALYFMHRGTSFRGRDQDMLAFNARHAEIKLEISRQVERRAKLLLSENATFSKQFTIDGKTTSRLAASKRLPVVLFEPDELRFLSSSPARRRDFFDGVISRLSPTYSTVLARFNRTLLQRNELLKQYEHMNYDAWQSHLFAWDVKFAELGATITKTRLNFIEKSNHRISEIYSNLAGFEHLIAARYVTELTRPDNLQQHLLTQLEENHQSDALRGYTAIGPHRDDIAVSLDNHLASQSASRGEMRTIMLAYKLLEVELQEEVASLKPLILMDDVFSELDMSREKKLIAALANYQTVVTATDIRDELKSNSRVISL